MFREGCFDYVYLCYGIHPLFNIGTSVQNDPQAVLIHGIEPLHALELMKDRKGKNIYSPKDGIGQGIVTKHFGIHVVNSGLSLCNSLNEKT